MSPDYLKIDGSVGEGGGSVLRVSSGVSCAINQPIDVYNIRSNRKTPGLRLQHKVGLEALRDLTGGMLSEIEVGSKRIKFSPGSDWNSQLAINVRTAGNISLLCQGIQIALVKAHSKEYKIDIQGGGTYGKWAPGTAYLQNVTYQLFKQVGYEASIEVHKHGFYPKGGAKSTLKIHPKPEQYNGFEVTERGELLSIKGIIQAENRLKKPRVGERVHKSIIDEINRDLTNEVDINICHQYVSSLSVGVGVDAWLEFSSGTVLGAKTHIGEKGLKSETLGKMVGKEINTHLSSRATVDEYAADQLVPILFNIPGQSIFTVLKPTSHLKTNLKLLSRFFKRDYELKNLPQQNLTQLTILPQ